MSVHKIETDVAILMPKMSPNTHERFKERYGGLERALADRGLSSFFAESHTSFDENANGFQDVFDVKKNILAEVGTSDVVRDLTMALDEKPLYKSGLLVVHDPEFNRLLANKQRIYDLMPEVHPRTLYSQAADVISAIDAIKARQVVIKPVTGQASAGVVFLDEHTNRSGLKFDDGGYLVQEYIDTSRGIPELGVEGIHNLRMISIGNAVIGAVVRERGSDSKMLRDDNYGRVLDTEEIPESFLDIADRVHQGISAAKGSKDSVIAIDTMRGIDSEGNLRDVLCEVNRRPVRLSPYDLRDENDRDHTGLLRIAKKWDNAEADMLAKLASKR